MIKEMKSISFTTKRNKYRILRVETDLGIINIYIGLRDTKGNSVESIEVLPDNRFAGEIPVRTVPRSNRYIRMIRREKK